MDKEVALDRNLVFSSLSLLKHTARHTVKLAEKDLGAPEPITPDTAGVTIQTLKSLKQKLMKNMKTQNEQIAKTRSRITHLHTLANIPSHTHPDYLRYSQTRMNVYIADYLLRQNYHETAMNLVNDSQIMNLVDFDLFKQSKKITDGLKAHSCTYALQWCLENKTMLKKNNSSLEFQLRIQEFVQLIKKNDIPAAIAHAKKHLAPWHTTHMKEIQSAMALIAYTPNSPYQSLYAYYFEPERWNELIHSFLSEFYSLYQIPNTPLLKSSLQAGLSSLKTQACYRSESKNLHCPTCNDIFNQLAVKLPYGHHVNSTLVCSVTGTIMNEHNPPMVLPNGYVYSLKAMDVIGGIENGIKVVVCPKTREVHELSKVRKAFIL